MKRRREEHGSDAAGEVVALADDEVTPGFGKGFLQRIFGGHSFIHTAVELVKNSRDWKAGRILIDTTDPTVLTIFDDGIGMNRANRDAFASINMSTASEPGQSGIFCTGVKQMLFSHASYVRVETAPKEESGFIRIFEFTTDQYEETVLSGGRFPCERLPKGHGTWPYDSLCGTRITFSLRNPKSKGILRGERLAGEIARRLPRKFATILHVDGKPIPEKEVVGRVFELIHESEPLGRVAVELYQLKRKTRRGRERFTEQLDDELLLSGSEVGEVPIRNFHSRLGDLKMHLPLLFLMPEVCGTISAEYLRDHANQDRCTLNTTIADDSRTVYLLRLLRQIAPQVQAALEIRLEEVEEDQSEFAPILDVIAQINARFNPEGKRKSPLAVSDVTDDTVDQPVGSVSSRERGEAIKLEYFREFELGETIGIEVKFSPEIAKRHRLEDLDWHVEQSKARGLRRTETGVELVGTEIGRGMLVADLKGTPISVTARYSVVAKRLPRVAPAAADVRAGDEVVMMLVNADKLRGKTVWFIEKGGSSGELEPQGNRAIFRAIRRGDVRVTVGDSDDRSLTLSCDIRVEEKERYSPNLLWIEDQTFEYQVFGLESKGEVVCAKPARIIRGQGNFHRIILNKLAPGYTQALEKGTVRDYLFQAIAIEYARFRLFELGEFLRRQVLTPAEVVAATDQFQAFAYDVFEQIITD